MKTQFVMVVEVEDLMLLFIGCGLSNTEVAHVCHALVHPESLTMLKTLDLSGAWAAIETT